MTVHKSREGKHTETPFSQAFSTASNALAVL